MKRIVLAVLVLSVLTNLYAGDMKINSDTHFDYSYEDENNSSFNLSRAYLTFSKEVNEQVSYKFQTDIGSGGPSDFTVYLKHANLAYKSDFGKLVFGLQGMNMFKTQENTWGYRFIEKSAMDLNKYSSSADLGMGWQKTFGVLTPSVLVTNGTGYKKTENDGYKKVSLQLLYGESKLKEGLNAGVVVSTEAEDYITLTATETGSTIVLGGFAGFAAAGLRVGVEFDMKSEQLEADKNAQLLSVYGNYQISKKLAGFGRFDLVDPDTDTNDDGYNYLILGLNYQPEKVFYIAPNVKVKMPETGGAETVYQASFRFNI
ncbi:MAG: hypothetical protein K9M55_07835 [Candidatus Marinimicrobia bacterium]|nr:hypothetical protein [Candidatus Neomarinimicrobiota bacterium]MCF7922596.1 hypothetical protein [Candidatus Neomarinimicrobiota bacterium]